MDSGITFSSHGRTSYAVGKTGINGTDTSILGLNSKYSRVHADY